MYKIVESLSSSLPRCRPDWPRFGTRRWERLVKSLFRVSSFPYWSSPSLTVVRRAKQSMDRMNDLPAVRLPVLLQIDHWRQHPSHFNYCSCYKLQVVYSIEEWVYIILFLDRPRLLSTYFGSIFYSCWSHSLVPCLGGSSLAYSKKQSPSVCRHLSLPSSCHLPPAITSTLLPNRPRITWTPIPRIVGHLLLHLNCGCWWLAALWCMPSCNSTFPG